MATTVGWAEYSAARVAAERVVRFKRRGEPGQYDAYVGDRKIAEIDKTGTHLDYWPWQVILDFPVAKDERGRARISTAEGIDTYRSAKEKVLDAWAYRADGGLA